MGLEFINDAISLSGLTGSKLKCEVIGEYYPFWWNITSGGSRVSHEWPTAIVELDAGTGEVYIEDTNETILGSAGQALELKNSNPDTKKLKIVLVEKNNECYGHLKRVINRRWSNIDIKVVEGPIHLNSSNMYLFNLELVKALSAIEKIELGNALFYFDPLRSVEYQAIERIARRRIKTYYKTGTEFIIFVFTSDWFLGRDDFAALPTSIDEKSWSNGERETVLEADVLLGDKEWRDDILSTKPIYERENLLVEHYRSRLHKWFRYVLPMPFNPKKNQVFHLILCSNFVTGVRRTRDFYCEKTGNPKYVPDNRKAFSEFSKRHPEVFDGLTGNRRPKQWLILWRTITGHEEGICDYMCDDFIEIEPNDERRKSLLGWLECEGYLRRFKNENGWSLQIEQYKLDWETIKEKLGVDRPLPFKPLSLKPLSLEEISK